MSEKIVFRINSPNIVHEIIDGEAVIINMELGYYYSIDKVGANIWGLLNKRASEADIIKSISILYAGDQKSIQTSVTEFLSELRKENLIVPTSNELYDFSPPNNLDPEKNKPPFEKPELIKYTDMQDLLLLDPIHEVDETGWPNIDQDIDLT